MTTIESRIYGGLLILASLVVIALVVAWAPDKPVTKCDGYNLNFAISKQIPGTQDQIQSDTFEINETIIINNETIGTESAEWIFSESANINVSNTTGVILSYASEGKKTVSLRINNREECTTEPYAIYIKSKCNNDGIQNDMETGIDCGGYCPPCGDDIEETPPTSLPPVAAPVLRSATCFDGIQNGTETGIDCGGNNCSPCQRNEPLPTANIQHIGGELKCNEYVTFDCGIPQRFNPAWSFDDLRTKQFFGKQVTHKFKNASAYTIRIYINNQMVGSRTFNIADCSDNPFYDGEDDNKPSVTPSSGTVRPNIRASISMSPNPRCNEKIIFRSNTPQGTVVRWLVDNNNDYRGNNISCTFQRKGTHTIKLYVGSNATPSDTKTFTVTCEGGERTSPTSSLEIDLGLKDALQDLSNQGKRPLTVVTKTGSRYQNILRDSRMCSKGRTKVRVNNVNEKTLDSYFDSYLMKGKVIIDEVRVKMDGNCIEKIYINDYKR